MARAGLNGTLSYTGGGTTRTFQVRVETITHGLKPVYGESQARARRAMYPHRMSVAPFMLGLVVVGQAERSALSQYLGSYIAQVLDPGAGTLAAMTVSVPSRGFWRQGVPVSGSQWGARVGQTVFRPQLVFETSTESVAEAVPAASAVPGVAAVGDGATQYFYPFGTQLGADQVPPSGALATWLQVIGSVAHLLDPSSWGQ